MSVLDQVFDSWSLVKAREAKGLHQWSKLQHIAHKLNGKQAHHISFTCSHPGHGEVTVIHNLGSVEGNLHFLMGYGNPGFYMLPYHWQVIDPNLSDEEAEQVFAVLGHPSRPELWKKANLEIRDEGEIEEGDPHPDVAKLRKLEHREKLKQGGIKAKSGYGTFIAVPSEGLVYSLHNSHVYKWDLVKDSYFASTNPDVVAAMEPAPEEPTETPEKLPEPAVAVAKSVSGDFDTNVYPLLKSRLPRPGSLIPVVTASKETVYGVVGNSSLSFVDKQGQSLGLSVFDKVYQSIDLTVGGNVYPSVVANFCKSYLGIDLSDFEAFVTHNHDILSVVDGVAPRVSGTPTPGFEDVPASGGELVKSVKLEGNTFTLVIGP